MPGLRPHHLQGEGTISKEGKEMIRVTEHAFTRAYERFHLNRHRLIALAQEAYTNGLQPQDVHGRFLDYLMSHYHHVQYVRVYHFMLFVFTPDKRLRTVVNIPAVHWTYIQQCMERRDSHELSRP